jgi:hypothetical protein
MARVACLGRVEGVLALQPYPQHVKVYLACNLHSADQGPNGLGREVVLEKRGPGLLLPLG